MSVGRAQKQWLVIMAAAIVLPGCKKDKPEEVVTPPVQDEVIDEAKVRWALDSARMEADQIAAEAPTTLPGSTWRLVKLKSSDDMTYAPEPGAVYSIEFGTDGRVNVVGGCNRGSGRYTVTPPSGLTFGPLATTRAMCPPGSLSSRFLGDFEHMRSYVLVGGRLHVSLMADGGIYEFAPEEKEAVAAGEPVIFNCSDSTGAMTRFSATFSSGNPGSVTLADAKDTVTVPQVRSGSGAKYEGPGVMFWNKGRAATATWRGLNLNCEALKL